jgi:hypothetical protein
MRVHTECMARNFRTGLYKVSLGREFDQEMANLKMESNPGGRKACLGGYSDCLHFAESAECLGFAYCDEKQWSGVKRQHCVDGLLIS